MMQKAILERPGTDLATALENSNYWRTFITLLQNARHVRPLAS